MDKKKSIWKKLVWFIVIVLVLLVVVVVIRTVMYPFGGKSPRADNASTAAPIGVIVNPQSVERFAGGIRIPTISEAVSDTVNNPFDRFKAYLPSVYPEIYKKLDTLTINKYGLLLRWKGSDPQLAPVLFCSHYDVVPVTGYNDDNAEGTNAYCLDCEPLGAIREYQTAWNYPPFSGAVTDGRIYGRGTLDMKGMLFGILEATDALLAEGFTPERDIWFAFGFDEETGGTQGAVYMARYFKERGIRFDAVYDEGGIISAPGLGGINKSLALVGTAEKGFLTVQIDVKGMGGHSSMPPAKGSLVLASEIVERLNSDQMGLQLIAPVSAFLDNVGGEMNVASQAAIANKWLLKGTLLKQMGKSPATNALVRTTTAVTMMKGSDAANVMASVAQITVNFRILTGESVADVVKHVEKACEGYDVDIHILSAREPSNTSPTDTQVYKNIVEVMGMVYPEAEVTPYLTLGGTDAYKYELVSGNVYRFMPVFLNDFEQRTMHNENEHISVENYGRMIVYFKELMRKQ